MGLFDVVGDVLGTNKSDEAIAAQTAGAAASNGTQKYIYDQNRQDQQPWRDAGVKALGQLQDPNFQKSFTMDDFHADPGYQFRFDEGQKALERSASAKGNLSGGAQLKALTTYGQNMGSQEYQNAYSRFNNDANTRFSRLSQLAGYGSAANSANATSGMNYGNNVSQTQASLGNANAAAYIGDANRNAGMAGQAASLAVFCDRRLKKDVERVSKEDLADMKRHLTAYKFRYRDEERFGKGDFIGVMAQDLEKSALGKSLVFKDNQGNLQIDVGRVMQLFLATMAEA